MTRNGQGPGHRGGLLWSSDAIAAATQGEARGAFSATGVSIDTRTLRPGDLFVALVGERDGHAHAAEALARGAAGVLIHRADFVPGGAPAVLVADTLTALTRLGAAGRARFSGRVVAVTGSVGKTTTKEMLRAALSAYGPTYAAEASYNNHWGVPLTLARLPADALFAVVEVGMNNPGEIAPLARLAAPDVAVVTAIAPAHIGHLGSLEAIADEKAAVFAGLARDGVGVLPADSALLPRLLAAAPAGSLTFGRASGADVRLQDAADGLEVSVRGRVLRLALSAPGSHMQSNAAAAIAVLAALGMDPAAGVAALSHFSPLPGRGLQQEVGGVVLLDESYNANPASVRAALGVLRAMGGRRRIAVLGDMLELGSHGPAEHAGLAADVEASADLLYACGPLMRHLFDSVPPERRGGFGDDAAALAPVVAASMRPGDAVLIKGSLGSRMRVIVAGLHARLSEGLL